MKYRFSLISITAAALIGTAGVGSAKADSPLSQLHVTGNRILDDSGRQVRLCGVNCACLEWDPKGEGHILDTLKVAIHDWNANIVRIPLAQDSWFGMGPDQKDGGAGYRTLVHQVVDYCASNRCYVLLDLHWNDCGHWGENIGQHVMPDMNSITFWRTFAIDFRNSPAVLFDLYNEPHDTTWDIWLNGGEITERRAVGARSGRFIPTTYRTPGMKAMLEAIRSTGATNVVVCGGLDWAYDLSGFLKGYALADPDGQGVIYACHAYNNKGESIDKMLSHVDAARPHIAVIFSEFGGGGAWITRVVKEIDTRKANYIAWDLHPRAGPTLVSDWSYKPTSPFGTLVKASLAKR